MPAEEDPLQQARGALIGAIGDFDTSRLATYKNRKIIHDPVWGTCNYEPWEVSLLELPVFQRLRGLRQTGFAHLTYPSAEHSRFQHTLGVVSAASRVFDSVVARDSLEEGLSPRGRAYPTKPSVYGGTDHDRKRWRSLVRVAALVHDLGHSVFSHTSERIYGMIHPFPQLADLLRSSEKLPGAAEIVVYLLVTSKEWQETANELWRQSSSTMPPPDSVEWERIGRWVMGQEEEPTLKFLADIISGPIDADKLDYVFRDGYAAGIPVGYDLERLISTICVDPQTSQLDGKTWWRLTLPIKGINALEQLVMGRLVLNSYLYHHPKCRSAESAFERALAREWFASRTVLGRSNVWDLFDLQDADVLSYTKTTTGDTAVAIKALLRRQLRVAIVEFRYRDLQKASEASSSEFDRLLDLGKAKTWGQYRRLIEFEDDLASKAGLPQGSVVVDIPKHPDYADLGNLLLPGRRADEQESPTKVLNYRDWIAAYKTHRAWVRVFGPRGNSSETAVWNATCSLLATKSILLPEGARIEH